MDHIAVPFGGSRPIWGVPLLPCPAYQLRVGSFHTYPKHFITSVFPELRASNPDTPSDRRGILALFVQSWLYFGVLCEFFNREIDPRTFGRKDDQGRDVLCSSPLLHLRTDWLSTQLHKTDKEQENECSRLITLLASATICSEQIWDQEASEEPLKDVLLSVRILLCSLAITIQAITRSNQDAGFLVERLKLDLIGHDSSEPAASPLLDHMLDNGWW
jgi:hypothetical protein